jgi:hypothetical protein
MTKRKFQSEIEEGEKVAKRIALDVLESDKPVTPEDVKQIVVSAVVEEVNQGGCSCGPWSLRILRTPTTPSLAKLEVSQKEQSIPASQSAPESA